MTNLRHIFFLIVCVQVAYPIAPACPDIFRRAKTAAAKLSAADADDYIGRSLPPYWAAVAKKYQFNFRGMESERRAVHDAQALLASTSGVEIRHDREVEVEFSDRWKVAARLFSQAGPQYAKEAERWDRMEKIRIGKGEFRDLKYSPLRAAVTLEFNRQFDKAARAYEALARTSKDPDLWKDAARCHWYGVSETASDFSETDHQAIRTHAAAAARALEWAGLHKDAAEAYARAEAWEVAKDEFRAAKNDLGVARMLRKLGQENQATKLLLSIANKYDSQNKIQEAIWAYREGGNTEKAHKLEGEIIQYLKTASDNDIASSVPLGGGKNGTFLVTFKKDGIQAVFKVIPNQVTIVSFSPERAKKEAKLWELDYAMGMDMTPITVARMQGSDQPLHGAFGSLQLFIHDGEIARNSRIQNSDNYGDLAWFDLFAANWDRHEDNYFIRSAGHVGIDNENAFDYHKYNSLENSKVSFEEDAKLVVKGTPPTREFYDKLKALTPERVRATFGDFHADEMIDVRQRVLDLMKEYVDDSGK